MATRHSTRRQPSGRARSNSKSRPTPALPTPADSARKEQARSVAKAVPKKKRKAANPPDYDEILGRFSEALALVEAAYHIFDAAQEDWDAEAAAKGCPAVRVLDHGIKRLRRAYSEVDMVFLPLSH